MSLLLSRKAGKAGEHESKSFKQQVFCFKGDHLKTIILPHKKDNSALLTFLCRNEIISSGGRWWGGVRFLDQSTIQTSLVKHIGMGTYE